IAVLKQTSPTAWPSAPRPKPSSTVPSASTRSAVGLWSGQAASFSDVVMSALHSRGGGLRQSRKAGDSHAVLAGVGSEEADHQDIVEILPIVLQGLHFTAKFGESHASIKPKGGFVGADHAELKLLHPRRGVVHDGFDQASSQAGVSRGWAHIHAPECGLVAHFGSLLRPAAGHPGQFVPDEGTEDVALGDPLLEPRQRPLALVLERA